MLPGFPPRSTIERLNAYLFIGYGAMCCLLDLGHSPIYGKWGIGEPHWINPFPVGIGMITIGLVEHLAIHYDKCYWRLGLLCLAIAFWGGMAGFYYDSIHPMGIVFPIVFTFLFLIPSARSLAVRIKIKHKGSIDELVRAVL